MKTTCKPAMLPTTKPSSFKPFAELSFISESPVSVSPIFETSPSYLPITEVPLLSSSVSNNGSSLTTSPALIAALTVSSVVLVFIIILVYLMCRGKSSHSKLFGNDRKTISKIEAWINSPSGQIEMNLSNRYQDVEIKSLDEPFAFDNPMPDNVRASLRHSQMRELVVLSSSGGGRIAGIVDDSVFGTNPLKI